MTSHDEQPRLVERLDPAFDERVINKVWHAIEDGRAPRQRFATRSWAVTALAVMLLGGAGLFALSSATPDAPLHLADAHALAGELGNTREVTSYGLDDGSRIELSRGAQASVVRNDGSEFVTVLRKGKSTFDVRPGGKRRWTIEAGVLTVQVLGTRFVVERSAARVRVAVERGVVLVRGEQVPERTQRLTAGQTIELEEAKKPEPVVVPVPVVTPLPPLPSMEAAPVPVEQPAAAPIKEGPSWRALAEHGDFDHAFAALREAGTSVAIRKADDVATLLLLADVARRAHAYDDAAHALEEALRRKPHGAEAVIAAFTLGKLEQESLRQPALARGHFAFVVEEGEGSELAEDALARLVDVLRESGARAAAKERAREYLRRFPAGRRRASIEAFLGSDT